MIDVKYQTQLDETASATSDFLTNRPVVSFLLFLMKICCIIFCLGFILKFYYNNVNIWDYFQFILAISWLIFYKKIYKNTIKLSLYLQRAQHILQQYQINKYRITWQNMTHKPCHIEWKKINYIYKNNNGFIIPLTGLQNAAKFIWLPSRGFIENSSEQKFLELLNNNSIKIKKITSGLLT